MQELKGCIVIIDYAKKISFTRRKLMMKKHVWEQDNRYSEIEDGRDVTTLELLMVYNNLMNEYKSIVDAIVVLSLGCSEVF